MHREILNMKKQISSVTATRDVISGHLEHIFLKKKKNCTVNIYTLNNANTLLS
jgi:hypothetical protein